MEIYPTPNTVVYMDGPLCGFKWIYENGLLNIAMDSTRSNQRFSHSKLFVTRVSSKNINADTCPLFRAEYRTSLQPHSSTLVSLNGSSHSICLKRFAQLSCALELKKRPHSFLEYFLLIHCKLNQTVNEFKNYPIHYTFCIDTFSASTRQKQKEWHAAHRDQLRPIARVCFR